MWFELEKHSCKITCFAWIFIIVNHLLLNSFCAKIIWPFASPLLSRHELTVLLIACSL